MKKNESNVPSSEVKNLQGKNKNLMRRLNMFLPQIASANRSLENDISHDKNLQIDISMVKEAQSDGDDSSEYFDDISEHSSAQDVYLQNKQSKEVIQMTFAIGNLQENDPIVQLLSNNSNVENKSILDLNSIDSDCSRNRSDTDDENEVEHPLFVIRSTKRK